jgi:predicted Na+-dependent transporter
MGNGSRIISFLKRFSWIVFFIIGIGVIIPVVISVLAGYPAGVALSFVLSAFALQAAVPPVGVAMGLPVWLILVILAWFAAGVVLGIYEICRTLGASSERVAAFVEKVEKKTEKYPMIKKYGPITCILIAWIPGIGLYGTPVIAWMLGWKRIPSVICTAAGFLIASIFVLFFASRINEILRFAGIAGLIAYAFLLSLSTGLAVSGSRFIESARQPGLLIPLLIVNFVLVPVVAFYLVSILGLPAGASAGIIIIAASGGAYFLLGFLLKAGGTLPRLTPLLAVLGVVTVFYLPLVLPLLLPLQGLDPLIVAGYLVLLFLIPTGAAMWIRSRYEAAAIRWVPRIVKISWIAFTVVVITLLALFTTAFFQIPGTMSVAAALLLLLIAYVSGYVSGGRDHEIRQAFGEATAERNLAAALVVAILVFREESVMAIVLVTGLIGLLSQLIWHRVRKRRSLVSGE